MKPEQLPAPWFEGIARGVRDAVIAIDATGSVLYMNPQAEGLTGWMKRDAQRMPLESVLSPLPEDSLSQSDHPILKAIHDGKEIILATHKVVAKDGLQKTIEDSLWPIKSDSRDLLGFIFVFRRVTPHLDMTELLRSIVAWAVELLRADAGDIFIYDEEQDVIRCVTSLGFYEEYSSVTLRPGEGFAGRVLQSGEPAIVEDYFAWEGRAEVFQSHARPAATVLKVPLKWEGKTIGVLGLDADKRERKFDQDDIRLATLFANVASVAIGNARLYQELQERMQQLKHTLEREVAERTEELAHRALQLETSARVSREITSILDIDELLAKVVELIRESFAYYYVQVFLVDETTNQLILRAGSGEVGRQLKERGLRLDISGKSLNSMAARTNEPLQVGDVVLEPHYLAIELLSNTRSELVIPMRVGGKVVGTLDVQSTRVNAFRREDALVIQSLGDQVAIAIENARLYDRSRELAVLEERTRLARELHDSVTQSLFSLDLHCKAISTYLKKDLHMAEAQIEQMRQITHDTLLEMRSLIYDLRPSALEEAGLGPGLRQLIERLRRPGGPNIVLHATEERRLSAEMEQGLFRIAHEALNNAIKHANAQHIQVILNTEPSRLTLSISDDGRGFDPVTLPANCHAFGLVGMRERVALLRGGLEIISHPGSGTCVSVQIPL